MAWLTPQNRHVNTSQVIVSVYQALEHNKKVALSVGNVFGWVFIYHFSVTGELLTIPVQRSGRFYTGLCFVVTLLKFCHICTNNPAIKALLMEIIGFWMVLTTSSEWVPK